MVCPLPFFSRAIQKSQLKYFVIIESFKSWILYQRLENDFVNENEKRNNHHHHHHQSQITNSMHMQ